MSGATKAVRMFRLSLLIRLDSLITFLKIAPTVMASKDLVLSGAFIINGIKMYNNFYTLLPGDIVQIVANFFKHSTARAIHGWLFDRKSSAIRKKLSNLAFLEVE